MLKTCQRHELRLKQQWHSTLHRQKTDVRNIFDLALNVNVSLSFSNVMVDFTCSDTMHGTP